MNNIRVGIVGVTGYGGQELLRLTARHPYIKVTAAMASSLSNITTTLPALTGIWSGEISGFSIEVLSNNSEAVFLALPDTVSATIVPQLLAQGIRVFDLSGAFRLRDATAKQHWYPETPELRERIVYGLTERRRVELKDANFVACPGCYPTAALLTLEPLAQAGLLSGDIFIDAKSGISGAGKAQTERTHFSECYGNISAYGIFAHRHSAEIEQELLRDVTFVPHLVPLNRGILETIYVSVNPGTTETIVSNVFNEAYRNEPFVRLRENGLPEIKHVTNTNFCDIGWQLDTKRNRLVLVTCLDNLIKGGAGQALQNFNVVYGFQEQEGLL